MVTTGILPPQGKSTMVEPGIEPGTSWLVVRSSDYQTMRLVTDETNLMLYYMKNQQDATLAVLFISNCKITLHVPDAFCSIVQ